MGTAGRVAMKYVQMNKGLWIKTTGGPVLSDPPGRGIFCVKSSFTCRHLLIFTPSFGGML